MASHALPPLTVHPTGRPRDPTVTHLGGAQGDVLLYLRKRGPGPNDPMPDQWYHGPHQPWQSRRCGVRAIYIYCCSFYHLTEVSTSLTPFGMR